MSCHYDYINFDYNVLSIEFLLLECQKLNRYDCNHHKAGRCRRYTNDGGQQYTHSFVCPYS